MPRMVSTASTARRPGQAARGGKTPASGQAKTRRRTSRPWLSSNASKQGRSDPPSANAFAANQAFTSAWGLLAVALEGQQVVAAPIGDALGDPGLAGERVQAHQA